MADTREKIEDATGRARLATQAAGDKAKESTAGVAGAVKEKVQEVAAGASQLAGKAKDTAREWASSFGGATVQAKDKAVEVASAAAAKAGDLGQDVTALIRRYPLPALLVGVGMGFLLGQLLSRRSSSGV
jgi:ElaB/YqjD/DUF883 family membrane-anchored ribosome-binding protein